MMSQRSQGQLAVCITFIFSLCTGFWAVMWHFTWPPPSAEPLSPALWVVMNLCNLGIIFLSLPTLWLLFADVLRVRHSRTWVSLAKYIPAFIFSVSTPHMFHPGMWLIAFFGAS